VLLVRIAWSEFLSCFTFTLPKSKHELTHFKIASISSGVANIISSASSVSRKSWQREKINILVLKYLTF
jgi:hypothetical protein